MQTSVESEKSLLAQIFATHVEAVNSCGYSAPHRQCSSPARCNHIISRRRHGSLAPPPPPSPPPHTHTEHFRAFSWLAHGTAGAYDSIEGTAHIVRGCRVPFEARSMAELRTKVMAGRFKPITPGKYSADLINLMGQLLQVNPQRRPEVSKILASSVVQKHAAGGSHKAAPAEPSSKGNVLQTIKVTQQRACFRCTLSQNVCCESSCLVLRCLTVFCS